MAKTSWTSDTKRSTQMWLNSFSIVRQSGDFILGGHFVRSVVFSGLYETHAEYDKAIKSNGEGSGDNWLTWTQTCNQVTLFWCIPCRDDWGERGGGVCSSTQELASRDAMHPLFNWSPDCYLGNQQSGCKAICRHRKKPNKNTRSNLSTVSDAICQLFHHRTHFEWNCKLQVRISSILNEWAKCRNDQR